MRKKQTAAIIGGGLSGLATAALLAKKGYIVSVFEKNAELGGRARVLKKKGFTFDMGPSWYMMPEVIELLFSQLGKKTKQYYSLVELKKKYRIFGDTHEPITFHSDSEKNDRLFANQFSRDHKGIKKLLQKTNKAYSLIVSTLLRRPYTSILSFLHPLTIVAGVRLLALFNPFQTYHSFIKRHVSNPLLQKVFEFHTVFLGGNPQNTPALYSLLIAADFQQKIWYPLGGVGQLVYALHAICVSLGVHIYTNAPVSKIRVNKNRVENLEINNALHSFDLVVSSADYAYTDSHLLPAGYEEYSPEYWKSRDYAISSVLVYLGVAKKMKKVIHHNFYFQSDWNEHFKTIQESSEYPKNPCFYLSAPSKTDITVAPKGMENMFLLIPVSIQTKTTKVEEYVDSVLHFVEEKIGESFIDKIVYKKIYAQTDFKNDYNAYKGNGLGIAHSLKQSVFMRPRMRSKKLRNLYYVGQYVQPGIGVPMVLLSALYLVNHLLRKK